MVQFAMQHPVATVFIVWLISDTITVAVKDICSVFDKKTKYTDNLSIEGK